MTQMHLQSAARGIQGPFGRTKSPWLNHSNRYITGASVPSDYMQIATIVVEEDPQFPTLYVWNIKFCD